MKGKWVTHLFWGLGKSVCVCVRETGSLKVRELKAQILSRKSIHRDSE